jgi:hypothetical protein
MTAGWERANVQKCRTSARSELPFPVTADPPVLDLETGHAPFRAAVPAPNPEGLMPILGLKCLRRNTPAVASAQPAEGTKQEHGVRRVSVQQSSAARVARSDAAHGGCCPEGTTFGTDVGPAPSTAIRWPLRWEYRMYRCDGFAPGVREHHRAAAVSARGGGLLSRGRQCDFHHRWSFAKPAFAASMPTCTTAGMRGYGRPRRRWRTGFAESLFRPCSRPPRGSPRSNSSFAADSLASRGSARGPGAPTDHSGRSLRSRERRSHRDRPSPRPRATGGGPMLPASSA